MLTALTEQAERVDREVIFRTWSVGVGAVGDMHTNDDSYEAVLGGIDSDRRSSSRRSTRSATSTATCRSTTRSRSATSAASSSSRAGASSRTSARSRTTSACSTRRRCRRFLAANPNVEGIWTWTQDGGPWRAGPLSLELKAGFWQLYELNTELAVRLARDPDADPAAITADWARRWFSDDPATVRRDRRGDGRSRAPRSPTGSTSARSPTGGSSRSASSRRP